MKTNSNFVSFLLSVSVIAFFISCSGNKKEEAIIKSQETKNTNSASETVSKENSETQFKVDTIFQQQLGAVFTSYVSLKDAFVLSDVSKIRFEASATNQALGKVNMKLLSGAAHNDWMIYLSSIQSALKEIETKTDIEVQRIAFSTLSDNLYKSIKAFGLGGRNAFYKFCPMAFNNEGGYWLSDQEQIQNPYFGDKMPACGSVVERLR